MLWSLSQLPVLLPSTVQAGGCSSSRLHTDLHASLCRFYLGGKDLPLLKRQAHQSLRNTSLGQRDGLTEVQFTRDLVPPKVAAAARRRLRSGHSPSPGARELSGGGTTTAGGRQVISGDGQTLVMYASLCRAL